MNKNLTITKEEFAELSMQEQNMLLFERQERIIGKINKLDELDKAFTDFTNKVKPILDKFPTEKLKSLKDGFLSKISKNKS